MRPLLPALGCAGHGRGARPLLRRGAARWFRETEAGSEGTDRDPFEPVSGWRGYQRIRARADGACGFLSADNRCRLHEELGAASKPLTCRMFPFKFHPVSANVVVTASFGCPTIVDNRGELVSGDAMRRELEATYQEHAVTAVPAERHFVAGRPIDAPSIRIIRDSLLRMLARADHGAIDLRVQPAPYLAHARRSDAQSRAAAGRHRLCRVHQADAAARSKPACLADLSAEAQAQVKLASEGGPAASAG